MYIKINIIQMLLSYVFLFGVSKDERPEGSDADLDFLPLETESETSCSDDSELSNIVEDLSFVMDSPPRSENDDLEVTAVWSRRRAKRSVYLCYDIIHP